MDTIEAEDERDAQREIIRLSLADIVNEIGIALREVGLNDAVYFTVPYAGLSLVTIATPLDPSDEVWNRIVEVACRTISKRLGIGLCNRDLLCAAANAPMSAAELMTV